jgi:hypothetical protein
VPASLSVIAKDEFHNRLSQPSNAIHANFERLTVSFDVKSQSADVYEILYTVTTAGKHALSVKIDERQVNGSPFVVTVHPSAADAATSVLHDVPSGLMAGLWRSFTAEPRDRFGNRVFDNATVPKVRVDVEHEHLVDFDPDRQVFALSIRITAQGRYSVFVTIGGQNVLGSPFTVQVDPGAHSCEKAELLSPNAWKHGIAGSEVVVQFRTNDIYGNSITRGGEEFSAVVSLNGSIDAHKRAEVKDHRDGTYSVVLAPSRTGVYNVHIRHRDQTVCINATTTIVPAAVDAQYSYMLSEDQLSAVAGTDGLIAVQMADRFGNNITEGRHDLEAELQGPGKGATSIADRGDGTYRVSYTADVVGKYRLNVRVRAPGRNLEDIKSSPFDVTITVAATSPEHTRVVSSDLNKTVGDVATLTVRVCDNFGNPQMTSEDTVQFQLSGASERRGFATRAADGAYSMSYTVTQSGSYELSVSVNRRAILSNPFRSVITPRGSDSSKAIVHAFPSAGVAGQPFNFTLQPADEFGNLIETHVPERAVLVLTHTASDRKLTSEVHSFENGSFAPAVVATVSGRYAVSLNLGGYPVPNIPSHVHIEPAQTFFETVETTGSWVQTITAGTETTFKVTAKDQFRNLKTKGGDDIKVVISDTAQQLPSVSGSVLDNYDGTYAVRYLITVAAKYEVDVKVNGKGLAGSPFSPKFIPGPVAPTACTFDQSEVKSMVAGVEAALLVGVRDQFGNLHDHEELSGASIEFKLKREENGAQIQSDIQRAIPGHVNAMVRVTAAGRYSGYVYVNHKQLPNSPFPVIVRAAAATSHNAKLSAPIPQSLEAGEEANIRLSLHDEFGNRREGNEELADISGGLSGPSERRIEVHPAGNAYDIRFSASVAGTYSFKLALKHQSIGDSSYAVNVRASTTTGSQSILLDPSPLLSVIAGESKVVQVVARDRFGNNRTSGGDFLSAEFSHGEGTVTSVQDHSDGTYSVALSATQSGSYRVDLAIGGSKIPRGPFEMQVAPTRTDADRVFGKGAGLSTAVAGSSAAFTLSAHDRFGNARVAGGDMFEARVEASSPGVTALGLADTEDHSNGNYTVRYRVTIAGKYKISVSMAGAKIPNSPFTIVATPATTDAAHSVVDFGTLSKMVAGVYGHFNVHLSDEFGNRQTQGGEQITLTLDGSGGNWSVLDHRNGSYTAAVVSARSGDLRIHVMIQGVPVPHSPFNVTVVPANPVSARRVKLVTTALTGVPVAIAGKPVELSLVSLDEFGNACLVGGAKVGASIKGPDTIKPEISSIDDLGNGTYLVVWSSTRVGTYTIDVNLGGAAIAGSPFEYQVVPAATASPLSKAFGPALSKATAVEVAFFQLQAVDSYGNNRTEGGDRVEISLTSLASGLPIHGASDVVDDMNGTYTCSIRLQLAGRYEMQVDVNDSPIVGSPFAIDVSTGVASSGRTMHRGSVFRFGYIDEACTFQIDVMDGGGNRRHSGGDNVTALLLDHDEVATDVMDHRNGTYSVSFTVKTSGRYKVSVLIDGRPVPWSIEFRVSSKESLVAATAQGEGLNKAEAGSRGRFEVLLKDEFGEPTNKVVVTAQIEGSSPCDVSIKPPMDGLCVVEYSCHIAGKYRVAVQTNSKEVHLGDAELAVSPGPANAEESAVTPSKAEGIVCEEYSAYVVVKDSFGNLRSAGGDEVKATLSGEEQLDGTVTDSKNGSYVARFNVRRAGNYKLQVRLFVATLWSMRNAV